MPLNLNRFKKKMNSVLNAANLLLSGVKVKNRFVILGSPRSGSNLLYYLMCSHDNVQIFPEMFNIFVISKDELNKILLNPQSYLDNFFNRKYPSLKKALGFKLFYNQATAEQLKPNFYSQFFLRDISLEMQNKIDMLQEHLRKNFDIDEVKERIVGVWSYLINDKDIKIIHLTRENKLKQYLSLVRAWQSDKWKSKSSDTKQDWHAVQLEHQDCLGFFEMATKREEEYNQYFKDHPKIDVVYEDMTRNLESEINRIQDFLDLPRQLLKANLKKQRKNSISVSIANYRELRKRFIGSEWERYFDE